jgi:O-antigen/teichoic acid export membrane protein
MKLTKASILGGSTRRGVLAIASGAVGGQIVALSAAPILTRLYTPTDFGLYAVLLAITVTLGSIAALRYELALLLPESDRDAFSLVFVGLISASVIAVLGTVTVAFLGPEIAGAFKQAALMPWLWFVPAMSALMASYILMNQLAVRQQRYSASGRRVFLQSSLTAFGQIGFSAAALGPGGLLAGFGIGQLAASASLLRGAGISGGVARAALSRRSMVELAKRYRRFPLLLAPAGLINVLGLQAPVLFMAYWYGGTVAGWLGMTQRVLALPMALIGSAIGVVYIGELSRSWRVNPRQAEAMFMRTSRTLALVSVPITVALVVLGPWLFAFVFGDQWAESGQYARALAFALAAQLVVSPLSQTLIVTEHQWLQLSWDVMRLVLTAATIFGGYLLGASALTTVWALGVSSVVLYVVGWVLSWRSLRHRPLLPAPEMA